MHNIENKCKKFKNECVFIYFAKSSLQNMIDSRVSMDCFISGEGGGLSDLFQNFENLTTMILSNDFI